MNKTILTSICFVFVGLLWGQSDTLNLKIHHLNVPDGFKYNTRQQIEFDLKLPTQFSRKSFYKLFGIDQTGSKDLIIQGFISENGCFQSEIKIPIHFKKVGFYILQDDIEYYFEWEKIPIIEKNLIPYLQPINP
ncbi:hypothetical protein OAF63_02565 [Saprospiraceae bacterium]|jgi:hypothetical protein|nr:hypothetical protein [Bacteroidota bacterium]MDB4727647.1 hypothetical protein [Saprospiraceae bacterium]